MEGLTSLMAVSSHFRKVAMAKLTKKDWVQKVINSIFNHCDVEPTGQDSTPNWL